MYLRKCWRQTLALLHNPSSVPYIEFNTCGNYTKHMSFAHVLKTSKKWKAIFNNTTSQTLNSTVRGASDKRLETFKRRDANGKCGNQISTSRKGTLDMFLSQFFFETEFLPKT